MRVLLAFALFAARVFAGGLETYDLERFTALQMQDRTVLLHFYSDGCPVCDEQVKALKALSSDDVLSPTSLQVDYQAAEELRRKYGVTAPSTILLFKGSRLIGRAVGMLDVEGVRTFIRESRMKARGRPGPRVQRTFLPKR